MGIIRIAENFSKKQQPSSKGSSIVMLDDFKYPLPLPHSSALTELRDDRLYAPSPQDGVGG